MKIASIVFFFLSGNHKIRTAYAIQRTAEKAKIICPPPQWGGHNDSKYDSIGSFEFDTSIQNLKLAGHYLPVRNCIVFNSSYTHTHLRVIIINLNEASTFFFKLKTPTTSITNTKQMGDTFRWKYDKLLSVIVSNLINYSV